jgi:hypothetical protein
MTDIVERLADPNWYSDAEGRLDGLCKEAKAEIEQLRTALNEYHSRVRINVYMEGPLVTGFNCRTKIAGRTMQDLFKISAELLTHD